MCVCVCKYVYVCVHLCVHIPIYVRIFVYICISFAFTCYVSSCCDNPSFTLCLQSSLSVAVTFQESVFMPSAWRSRLHTSLKRSWGRPVGLFSVVNSPYKRSFRMQPYSIHATCSSHRMRLCFKGVCKLSIPAFSSTALFVTMSCHVISRVRLKQCT